MGTIKTNVITPKETAYIEVSRQSNNGDGTGRFFTYKYRGSKDALRLASLDWVKAGGKYQITEDGPYSEATVTFSGSLLDPNNPTRTVDPTEEDPAQRYEFRTEYLDASLFALPAVRAEAKRFASTFGAGATEADYFSAIKLSGEDPKNNKLTFSDSLFPLAGQLVIRLARGQDSFQTSRVSLTRISTYSALNGLPQTPPIISAIYDGPNIANLNGFPTSVRNVMPRPPSNPNLTPDGTAWAWLKTNDSTSLTIKTNQVERNETWTFAAWDLFAYPYNADPRTLTYPNMADEIQMTARLYASKGGAFLPSVTYTKSATMAGVDMGSQTQSIGTTVEALNVPVDVSSPYKLLISNLDNTNFVEAGFVSGTYTMRIPAGETLLMPYVSATLYLKADTSSVTIQATFCEI